MPVDISGYFTFSYFGKPGRLDTPGDAAQSDDAPGAFSVVPYETFFSDGSLADDPFYRNYFRDKIVLIGDTTKVGNDHRLTPVGDMWGMEIHAHAMATVLRGLRGQAAFVREAPVALNVLAIAVAAALVCALAGFARINVAALASGALVVLYFFGNAWLYAATQLKLSLVAPSLSMVMAAAALLLQRGLTEEKEKNRARGLLHQHLSPQIADYVLDNPDMLHTRSVYATVLFSDIRGFTSMSEKLSPEQMLERLNEYFQAMTDQVFACEGAVDKYIGDAIMALFGVPVPQPDHAERAVASAIAMQERLLELQEKWRREGLPPIDIGIGINTGDMVMGYTGARNRLNLTVIGDAVNLASRVESLNKEMGTRILITRSTRDSVKRKLNVRGPFSVMVKGKEEAVEVFEVLGWLEEK
jgi:adenylate cyclase